MLSKAVWERLECEVSALSLFTHDVCRVISILCRYSKVFAGTFFLHQLRVAMDHEPSKRPRWTTYGKKETKVGKKGTPHHETGKQIYTRVLEVGNKQ